MHPMNSASSPVNVYGISAGIEADGRLVISADADGRARILELYADLTQGYPAVEAFVVEALRDEASVDWVEPEWIGALTDAPIFTDALDYPDHGDPQLFPESRVWWFPSYAVIDPWQELADNGFVRFDAASEA